MAATGNEVPLLSQLLLLKDWIVGKLGSKLDSPTMPGANVGDILIYQLPGSANPSTTAWSAPQDAIPPASSSDAGLMSAADKAKLDGLPSSFTAPAVDIVKTTEHQTTYTKDTLEIVCDDTGKVTAMYFVSV